MVNELLGWNTHPIGLVSSWSETPENSLCVFVSFLLSLFPTPHHLWGLTEKPAWEERVLTRTSPCWHPDLGLLAPRLWGNKFLLFISQSLLYSFMAFLPDKYKIIYFAYLKKKMNERKLNNLFHFLGNFEISQNWSFHPFPHLSNWRLLWPRECAFAAFLFKG